MGSDQSPRAHCKRKRHVEMKKRERERVSVRMEPVWRPISKVKK